MTLWAILATMTSTAALFLAALFLRTLTAREPSASPARFFLGERSIAIAAMSVVTVLGLIGLFAPNDGPGVPPSSARSGASMQPGASAVDRLAAATAQIGGLPQEPLQPGIGNVDDMIEQLADRLAKSPDDPEGWRMLGWSYFNTERFAQAAGAYAKAIALNPQNADFRSSRGEALVRAADGRVTDEAKATFAEALTLDAKDPRARFFLGLAKEQAGNKLAALDDWIAILNETDSSEAWVGDLKQRVAELGRETGIDIASRLPVPRAAPAADLFETLPQPGQAAPNTPRPDVASNLGAPGADDIRSAEPADRQAMIQAMVERLASRLRESPRDVEGWIKLMRSRQVLGERDAAEQAFGLALDAFKDAPQEQDRISTAARELGLMK